jgi:hypothetical protein
MNGEKGLDMGSYFRGPWQDRQPHHENRRRLAELARPIRLYDLGAGGGTPPPFCMLLEAVEPVNFEPDERTAVEQGQDNLPIAIGPSHLTELHLNRRPTTSSLLPACRRIVDRYDWSVFGHTETSIFDTIEMQPVRTLGLDEAIGELTLPSPDFIKLDVQGVTLEVLESGRKCMADTVLGLQAEVEFLESYAGQQTFGPVQQLLEQLGFELFRLSNISTWRYKTSLDVKHRPGQVAFCDVLYFRSIDSIGEDAIWNEANAVQMLRLLLLHDLTDSAAAYWERFQEANLIGGDVAGSLRDLICQWPGALEYLYHPSAEAAGAENNGAHMAPMPRPNTQATSYDPPPPLPRTGLLDKTPRQILRALRRRLTGTP